MQSSLGDAEIVIVWGELNKTYIREHNIWKARKQNTSFDEGQNRLTRKCLYKDLHGYDCIIATNRWRSTHNTMRGVAAWRESKKEIFFSKAVNDRQAKHLEV